MERRLQIRAVLEEVREACDFVVEAAEDVGLDSRAVYHCEMAVDETCTNVVEHGHKSTSNPSGGMITITTRLEDNCLKIIISDNSPPFDPTQRHDPDMHSELYKREPGGWGIYFVKQLMDDVQYAYHDGQNHLSLTKCLPMVETLAASQEMTITVAQVSKGYWSLSPHGRLDSISSPLLSNTLNEQLRLGHAALIIDLSEVDYVSSSGLKVLAAVWRDTRERKGNLMLVGLNPRLQEIFDMVGFTTFFDVFPDLDHALAHNTNL